MPTLFIFHRDLRIEDNMGLQHAGSDVIPCFIFDDRQKDHDYFSKPGFRFMVDSLRELDASLRKKGSRLFVFRGNSSKIVGRLIEEFKIDSVHSNKDYTPFAQERDLGLKTLCEKHLVSFIQHDDALLFAPGEILKDDGTPYTIFTPFFKKGLTKSVSLPIKNKNTFFSGKTPWTVDIPSIEASVYPGGRSKALAILGNLATQKSYDHQRDYPSLDSTTHLSPHLKFGTISAREAYHSVRGSLGSHHSLLRELFWRDFFTNIAYHFPRVFGHCFHKEYEGLHWENDSSLFEAWCQGKTGFPIVDAGMRELNQTGFMHNRVRMIVASFLVKDLHIDWRLGEKYFAQHLVDYDPCVNNGNWQWAASTGCDAQPYFRIFNPWLQQKKFDPQCRYIKKWIPELRGISIDMIHSWWEDGEYSVYPKPVVEHAIEKEKTLGYFKKGQIITGDE